MAWVMDGSCVGIGQEVKRQRTGAKAQRCPAVGAGRWEDRRQEAPAKGGVGEEAHNGPCYLS